ncbi:hypothetical protein PHJA_002772900, partial [Phtheirospermum japonicum]
VSHSLAAVPISIRLWPFFFFICIWIWKPIFKQLLSAYVLILYTTVVAAILIACVTWDVPRKVTQALMAARVHGQEMCRGGICWHGVAVKSSASQVQFCLPQHHNP